MAAASASGRPCTVRRRIVLIVTYLVSAAVLWWFLPPAPRFQLGSDGTHYRYPVFSPDGSLLAVATGKPGQDAWLSPAVVQLRNSTDGSLKAEWPVEALDGHARSQIQFAMGGRWLAAFGPAEHGHQVVLWNVDSRREVAALTTENVDSFFFSGLPPKIDILFAPGGRTARMHGLCVLAKDVILWTESHGRDRVLENAAWPCAFSADGGRLATIGQQVSQGWVTETVAGGVQAIFGGAALPCSSMLAAQHFRWGRHDTEVDKAFVRAEVQLWDPASASPLAVWPTPTFRRPGMKEIAAIPLGMTFSRDGQTLAAVAAEKSGHKAFAAELNLATGVWSEPTAFPPLNLPTIGGFSVDAEKARVNVDANLRYLPGGRRLLVDLPTDPASFLIDLDTKKAQGIGKLETAVVRTDGTLLAYLSPVSVQAKLRALVSGIPPSKVSPPSVVQVLDPATGAVRDFCSVPSEVGELAPLAFSPDGRYLAVRYFGGDGWRGRWNQVIHGRTGVRLYEVASSRFSAIPYFYQSILSPPSVAFSADGHSLAVWSDGRVGVYDLPPRIPWAAIASWAFVPVASLWLLVKCWWMRRRRVPSAV